MAKCNQLTPRPFKGLSWLPRLCVNHRNIKVYVILFVNTACRRFEPFWPQTHSELRYETVCILLSLLLSLLSSSIQFQDHKPLFTHAASCTCGTNFLLLFVFLISLVHHHHPDLLHHHILWSWTGCWHFSWRFHSRLKRFFSKSFAP